MSRDSGIYIAAAILIIAVTISSCASDVLYDPQPPGSPVKVFREYLPECDFVELGNVTDSDGENLKNAARAMGGNGLIVVDTGSATTWIRTEHGRVPVYDRKSPTRGTVIFFTNPACTE